MLDTTTNSIPQVTDPTPSPPKQDLATLLESIRKHLKAGVGAAADFLHHALSAGDALILAKAKAGHGGWLKFLRACDLSEDRAERYMRLARGRDELNSASVRNLSLNAALRCLKSRSQEKKQTSAKPKARDGVATAGATADAPAAAVAEVPPARAFAVTLSVLREANLSHKQRRDVLRFEVHRVAEALVKIDPKIAHWVADLLDHDDRLARTLVFALRQELGEGDDDGDDDAKLAVDMLASIGEAVNGAAEDCEARGQITVDDDILPFRRRTKAPS